MGCDRDIIHTALILFALVIENVKRLLCINTSCRIFYRNKEIVCFANDFDNVGSSEAAAKIDFATLKEAAREVGVVVDTHETKYIHTE